MSDFRQFFKDHKIEKKDIKYAVTKSIVDKDGKPVKWTLRHLTSKEIDQIKRKCTYEKKVPGRNNQMVERVDTDRMTTELITAAIVVPDLRDSALQDSSGVKTPQDLLFAMVDEPGEYAALEQKITEMNGLNESLDEKVEQAKNS